MPQINCPSCGAKTNSLFGRCEYCSTEIKTDTKQTVGSASDLDELEHQLENQDPVAVIKRRIKAVGAEDNEARVAVIREISIPNGIKQQLELLSYCDSNQRSSDDDDEKKAWRSKAKSAYDRLKMSAIGEASVLSTLSVFEKTYNSEALAQIEKKEKIASVIYTIIGCIIIAICVYACKHKS